MPINFPGQKQKAVNPGQIIGLAGQMVGGAVAGPVGATLGGMLGQMAGDKSNKPPPQPVANNSAMGRRMQSMQPQGYDPMDDPMKTMQEADAALAQTSPEMQKRYRPILQQGMQAYQGGMA